MFEIHRWSLLDTVLLFLVIAVATGARLGYLWDAVDGGAKAPALTVQGSAEPADNDRRQANELETLVRNLEENRSFSCHAPLADKEERTAHVAPLYPWLISLVSRWDIDVNMAVRWGQAVLGIFTVACYFLFARRAFDNLFVGLLAGLLTALHPFWIINIAEISDGTLASFLLGLALWLGTRAGQSGGALSSLAYGLALAGMAMTRAALLPFAMVAIVWFLLRCRAVRGGFFCALLAILGFGNGLAPWAVRNYREFEQPVPVADSAMLQLWIGNNPKATGGRLDERELREALAPDRLRDLLGEANQARRYNSLCKDAIDEAVSDPGATITRRLWAGLNFVFGESWFKQQTLAAEQSGNDVAPMPDWLSDNAAIALRGALLVMIVLGLLGWRFSFGWRKHARLAALAAIWAPLPYFLSHADSLSGPRLPLDGVLLTFAAFALACCFPGVRRAPPAPLPRVSAPKPVGT